MMLESHCGVAGFYVGWHTAGSAQHLAPIKFINADARFINCAYTLFPIKTGEIFAFDCHQVS
jgi:hypothetical protein